MTDKIIFSKRERDMWLLCVRSQLNCQNEAIQKYQTLIHVPQRYQKFRYEKLYRMAGRLYPQKNYVKDFEYLNQKDSPAIEKDLGLSEQENKRLIYIKERNREKSGIKTMYNIRPINFLCDAKKETFIKWSV